MKEINKEIKKTFTEMDKLMRVLYGRFKNMTNMLSKVLEEKKSLDSDLETHDSSRPSSNDDLLAKISIMAEKLLDSEKDIETRLDHLFDNSKPPLDNEKKLLYNFYELQEMLTNIVSGLPGLVNEKGEMDKELLTLLTNVSAASEKLRLEKLENETEEEEERIIPTKEDFYKLFKELGNDEIDSESEEIHQLKIDLEEKEKQNAELREKLTLLEVAEENRNNQLRQREEKEQQLRDKIETELELINHSSPRELTTEELIENLKELQKMKSSLNDVTTNERILKKTIGSDENKELKELKKASHQIKLDLRRRNAEQVIADALADRAETVLEKRVEVKQEELPDYKDKSQKEGYRNYSQTLDKMDNPTKIYDFEREILQVIAEQRKAYELIIFALSLGEKAIENKNIKKAKKAKDRLTNQCSLLKKSGPDGLKIYLKKANDFYITIGKLNDFIEEQGQTTAQIVQLSK